MFIQLEHDSDIALYEQLTRQIIEGIAKGELLPGERLPSVRNLAADLGVNMHTVNRSYAELEKKGILEIKPKSGAIIKEHARNGVTAEQLEVLGRNLKPVIAEGKVLGASEDQLLRLMQQLLGDLKFTASKGV